jgi:hypothetical protein
VAAVETHINEIYLTDDARREFETSALWQMRREFVERLELREKLILVSQLHFGNALLSDQEPLQSLLQLVTIRNALVHYKMDGKRPTCVDDLQQKGVALPREEGADGSWVWDVSCSEGIRWAHNTAARTIRAIHAMIGPAQQKWFDYAARGYDEITRADAEGYLRSLGVPDNELSGGNG